MKILLLTICISCSIIFFSSGQERKKKTETNKIVREDFYIDKDSKLKDGAYFAIDATTKDTLATGNFNQGLRSGRWVFWDIKTKEKKLEYDFSQNSVVFIESRLYPDSFLIRNDNEIVFDKVDRPLIFLGYDRELMLNLTSQLKITKDLFSIPGQNSNIAFLVDENGNLTGSKIISSFSPSVDQSINNFVNTFNGRLLPAVKDGQPVKSMFYVKIILNGPDENDSDAKNDLPYIFSSIFKIYTY